MKASLIVKISLNNFFHLYKAYQKSFGEPNQQSGVKRTTTMIVQSHEVM